VEQRDALAARKLADVNACDGFFPFLMGMQASKSAISWYSWS